MKKIVFTFVAFGLLSCAEMQQVMAQLPQGTSVLSQGEIGNGLKEALNNGISKQVSKLTATDGFFKNEALKVINRAAEDAVKEATPIFVDAVKQMTFTDAKNILMGNESSATTYLQNTTSTALYAKFNPVIKNSFTKVGADKVWKEIITKYNSIPLVKKVNPDLTDYTTNKAMEGVFKMIAVEEKDIRTNLASRSSDLLKKVFALQDKK